MSWSAKSEAQLESKVDWHNLGKIETVPHVDVLTYAFQEGRYNQLIDAITVFEILTELNIVLVEGEKEERRVGVEGLRVKGSIAIL